MRIPGLSSFIWGLGFDDAIDLLSATCSLIRSIPWHYDVRDSSGRSSRSSSVWDRGSARMRAQQDHSLSRYSDLDYRRMTKKDMEYTEQFWRQCGKNRIQIKLL